MSHYASYYARRPRLHGHGRYIFSKEGDSDKYCVAPGIEIPSSMPPPPRKDLARGPKVAMVMISIILLLGSFVHYVTIEDGISGVGASKLLTKKQAQREGRSETDGDNGGSNATADGTAGGEKITIMNTDGVGGGGSHIAIIPPELSSFADLIDPLTATDVPFFWHIPRSGGSTFKDIAAFCLMLVQASHFGGTLDEYEDADELMVIEDIDRGAKFVNVDTTTSEGLQRAIEMGIGSFEGLDLIFSPLVFEVTAAFSNERRGRMFAMFRHPVDRAVSMYYYLYNDPKLKEMLNGASLEEYARVGPVENNWMVRFLSNAPDGELTADHEAIAKEVLRRKCLIGILGRKAESLRRFEQFFGWKITGEKMEACHERLLIWDWANKNKHPLIKEGTTVWKLLENYNLFDIRLYYYAEELFIEQAGLFTERSEGQYYQI